MRHLPFGRRGGQVVQHQAGERLEDPAAQVGWERLPEGPQRPGRGQGMRARGGTGSPSWVGMARFLG